MTSLDNITIVLRPSPAAPVMPINPWWMDGDYPRAKRRRIAAIGDTVWTVVFPSYPSVQAKTPFNAIARTMGIVSG